MEVGVGAGVDVATGVGSADVHALNSTAPRDTAIAASFRRVEFTRAVDTIACGVLLFTKFNYQSKRGHAGVSMNHHEPY